MVAKPASCWAGLSQWLSKAGLLLGLSDPVCQGRSGSFRQPAGQDDEGSQGTKGFGTGRTRGVGG